MERGITIEGITSESTYRAAIKNKSTNEANAICMQLVGEALIKGQTSKANLSAPHLLASVLYQACPGPVDELREYVYKYVDCDSRDGVCLALGCWEDVFCWRKCADCYSKVYWLSDHNYEHYYYKCQKYARECRDPMHMQSRKSMFCRVHDQVGGEVQNNIIEQGNDSDEEMDFETEI